MGSAAPCGKKRGVTTPPFNLTLSSEVEEIPVKEITGKRTCVFENGHKH